MKTAYFILMVILSSCAQGKLVSIHNGNGYVFRQYNNYETKIRTVVIKETKKDGLDNIEVYIKGVEEK